MPRFDLRCTACGDEREVVCKSAERDAIELVCKKDGCVGALEFLIGLTAQTRGGFGFAPGVVTADGKLHNVDKRRPATVEKVRG